MYVNAYKCKAAGLSVNEVKCLVFAKSEPDEKVMTQLFANIPLKLERYGLLELAAGVWYVTDAGISKLNACVPHMDVRC